MPEVDDMDECCPRTPPMPEPGHVVDDFQRFQGDPQDDHVSLKKFLLEKEKKRRYRKHLHHIIIEKRETPAAVFLFCFIGEIMI
ncbi:MAG: hypothetical protein ACE5OR_12180 [bacterium]